jgi:ribose transport system permease protein/inositol transport system permease protein
MTQTTTNARATEPETSRGPDYLYIASRLAAPLFLLFLVVLFALLEPNFLNPFNLLNTLRQVSFTGLIAVGMTFVILTAGIDLSVGSLLALAGMVGAYVAKGGLADRFAVGQAVDAANPWQLAVLAALAVGMIGGAAQGFTISKLKVPPFVVTLGGLTVFRGLTLMLSEGGPISGFEPDYNYWGQGRVDILFLENVPVPALIFVGVAIIAAIVLRYTRFGQHVYATGGNRMAAKLNGVPTDRIIFSVYVIVGMLAGLAGFLLSARLGSAEAVAGIGFELAVIAAVVIGGTSLFGGVGGIFGTVVGVLLIGVLTNGLVLLNVSSFVQQVIIGLVLIAAVAFDQFATRGRRQGA